MIRLRWTWREWALLAAVLAALLALSGCGTRENARAAIQADQAAQGVQEHTVALADLIAEALAKLEPEQQEAIRARLRYVLDLAGSARRSLAPVISLLGDGQPVDVATEVPREPEAVPAFVAAAAEQAGRASLETRQRLAARSFWRGLADTALGGGWESVLAALGLTTTGGLGLVALRAFQAYKKTREAVKAAADYGEELEQAADPEVVAAAKAKAAKAQDKLGVRAIIQRARGKAPT